MNILITGSAGFIGLHTSLKLIEKKKCQLFGIDKTITETFFVWS